MAVIFTRSASIDRYRDLDLNFTAHPVTGDITPLIGEDAIKRSLRNLVLLQFYEVPFNPFIGSEVNSLLFENFTPVTEVNIDESIRQTVEKYEPRVEILNIDVDAQNDDNAVSISIEFLVVNRPEPIVVNIILERTK